MYLSRPLTHRLEIYAQVWCGGQALKPTFENSLPTPKNLAGEKPEILLTSHRPAVMVHNKSIYFTQCRCQSEACRFKMAQHRQNKKYIFYLRVLMVPREKIDKLYATRMWANAQRDGRPAEYRWRPLFNAAKFA